VANDPGAPLIWIGSIFLLSGLTVTLMICPHTLMLQIQSSTSGKQILIAGSGRRNSNQINLAASKIAAQLHSKLNKNRTSEPEQEPQNG